MGTASVIIFDVYGTLLNISSPVARLSDEIGPQADRLSDLWRHYQLELLWVTTMTGKKISFWEATDRALATAMASVGLSEREGLKDALLDAYRAPEHFDDAGPALSDLACKGYRLGVYSNAEETILRPALRSAGLEDLIETVGTTAESSGYKPARSAYERCAHMLSVEPSEAIFVSSNAWDVAGAGAAGFLAAWINRNGMPFHHQDSPAFTVTSLSALASQFEVG
ncbi:haloacid dehalogenase type II [uncultured Roseobacter sp.]|uniref:haloacid dehalogenase type II n=1 Tax=uncultured Roseobacter sp. TaxID=114847 RepID=UPI00262D5ABB|nr:haloacid dehalogenase type II [uncultured Roseobacter sp.]